MTKTTLEELRGYLKNAQENLSMATQQRDALIQFIEDNPRMGQFNDTLALCRNQSIFAEKTNRDMVNNYVKLIEQHSN